MNTDSVKIHKLYSKYLRGKTVALVGPAWHTKGTKQKDLIHSYDIVVRMNQGCIEPSEKIIADIGDRADILYCALSLHCFKHKILTSEKLKKMKKNGLKWIASPLAAIRRGGEFKLNKINEVKIPVHHVREEYYKLLLSSVRKKVSTGLVTIYDLLQFDIKKLYITGMSFCDTVVIGKKRTYYSNYNMTYGNKRGFKGDVTYVDPLKANHNYRGELLFFSDSYKKDKRIHCDEVLKKTIDYYDKNNG